MRLHGVDPLELHLVHFVYKVSTTLHIFDTLADVIFFALELIDSCLHFDLLIQYNFLVVESLIHVRLSVVSYRADSAV